MSEKEFERPTSPLSLIDLLTRIPSLTPTEWHSLSFAYQWLIMVRAAVLMMTVTAGLTGILLALAHGVFYLDRAIALFIGLTFAHASNNLLNDWGDHKRGVDRGNYFRRRYGVHVLEDRLIDDRRFWQIALLTGGIAVGAGSYLVVNTDIPVFSLMMTGAFFCLFYTWPLKHFALGELAVLLVWGPLMVAGSYFVMAEQITWEIMIVSVIAGIGPTLVIFGKHIDKIDDDGNRKVNTLPVVIGARASRWLCIMLICLQWLLLGYLMVLHHLHWLGLMCLAFPHLLRLIQQLLAPPPAVKPANYPDDIWPLWYAAQGFAYARATGVAMMAGLIVASLLQ